MKKISQNRIFKEALLKFTSEQGFILRTSEEDEFKPFLYILNLLDSIFNKVVYEPHREDLYNCFSFEMTYGVHPNHLNDLSIKSDGLLRLFKILRRTEGNLANPEK